MSRKVFTAGEVLAAADVNSFLMDQTVMSFAGTAARGSAIGTAVVGMVTYLEDIDSLSVNNGTAWTTDRTIQVFAGTAARGSAIPTPVEGMYAHLNDTDTLQYYNGSAWTNAGATSGLTLLSTTTFSAVASQAIPVGSFSATYDFYRIICDFTAATADAVIFVKMRASGTDSSSTYVSGVGNITPLGSFGSSGVNSGTSGFNVTEVDTATASTHLSSFVMDLQRPFLATSTTMQLLATATSSLGAYYSNFGAGVHVVSTSYDQINVIASAGNISGKIQVYGYSQ